MSKTGGLRGFRSTSIIGFYSIFRSRTERVILKARRTWSNLRARHIDFLLTVGKVCCSETVWIMSERRREVCLTNMWVQL